MIETTVVPESAVLIGVTRSGEDIDTTREHLDEMAFLVETAGGIPGKRFIQRMDYPDPKTYVGSGKLKEIKAFVSQHKIDLAIFDDELSPDQLRNIEKELSARIIDRNSLILDIFAKRARSSYAKTQVELAQNEYLLPRLTRRWTHLEKQRGGIGLRGPGEQEIETDRRYLRWRIKLLKQKLREIDKQKATQRKNRRRMIRVALVGYTNVGKSTIMNLLSRSNLFAENKLFATLDTTIRKVVIDHQPFLLSDTVGFIRKLPHSLIESFKSTLDEVREADILIHVVDISHPDYEEQIHVVKETLVNIHAANKPTIMVFNKIDAYKPAEKDLDDLKPVEKSNLNLDELENIWIARENSPSIFISAMKKSNIDTFRKRLYQEVRKIQQTRWPERKM
ncbi:MAG: GTPase HflX [Bacteroidales bacterium]|nr:GTPase HflX [Bacteroidota bacterium]MBL6949850.1 GTPase HflX [Bacteroidales bacterium]